jgi:hypothetical protein
MDIDGSCHCGRITYRAQIDPEAVYVCHCTDCQKISGSPFRWAVSVPQENFELLGGTLKTYVKTIESGRKNHQKFCADCASPIYSTVPGREPVTFNLRLGTARQRDQLRPRVQSWCQSAQGWAVEIPGAERIEKQ